MGYAMSKKIGEALVERGLITAEQLGTALQAQNSRGGRLGLNLMELGMIDERELGHTLGELCRSRYAPPEVLEEVDEAAYASLPRELVEKHRAVPLKQEDRALHLLVASLDRLSGLSRATGRRIVPWIAPEVRVARELDRRYEIPMGARVAQIVDRLKTVPQPDRVDEAPAVSVTAARSTDRGAQAESGQDQPPAIGSPLGAKTQETDAAYGYGRSWREIAGELDNCEVDALKREFCSVNRSEDAVRLLLDQAARSMTNCVLFRVNDDTASIWADRSSFIDRHARASVAMPLASGSLLELLAVRPHFRGPVPQDHAYRVFFTMTGLPLPREIVLIPIRVANRVVAVLYGDGGMDGKIGQDTADLLELVRRFALALTLVVIKKKIMR
jgi:hypothetical protein